MSQPHPPSSNGRISKKIRPGRPVDDQDTREGLVTEAYRRYGQPLRLQIKRGMPEYYCRRDVSVSDIEQQSWLATWKNLGRPDHRFRCGEDMLRYACGAASRLIVENMFRRRRPIGPSAVGGTGPQAGLDPNQALSALAGAVPAAEPTPLGRILLDEFIPVLVALNRAVDVALAASNPDARQVAELWLAGTSYSDMKVATGLTIHALKSTTFAFKSRPELASRVADCRESLDALAAEVPDLIRSLWHAYPPAQSGPEADAFRRRQLAQALRLLSDRRTEVR